VRAADLHRLARAVREIALLATENTGDDRVNPGELAVLEDIARNPGATIGEIARRTGFAQSLVSRITHAMADAGVVTIAGDGHDRRKVRVELGSRTRAQIIRRAGNSIADALSTQTPALTPDERAELEHHLAEAERLLRVNAERSDR
jgi:DNA-binding MarR family transcriptional regulator